jgi:hypothetical protein
MSSAHLGAATLIVPKLNHEILFNKLCHNGINFVTNIFCSALLLKNYLALHNLT